MRKHPQRLCGHLSLQENQHLSAQGTRGLLRFPLQSQTVGSSWARICPGVVASWPKSTTVAQISTPSSLLPPHPSSQLHLCKGSMGQARVLPPTALEHSCWIRAKLTTLIPRPESSCLSPLHSIQQIFVGHLLCAQAAVGSMTPSPWLWFELSLE